MRLTTLCRCAAVVAGAGVFVPVGAAAQAATSELQMTAEGIIDVAITGSGVRNLEFGVVTPGVPVTVGVTSTTSAKWRFSNLPNNNGQNNRFADLAFTALPATLNGANGATMAVTGYTARVCLEKPTDSDYYCYGDYAVSPAAPGIDPNPRINPTGGAGEPPTAPGGNTGRALVVYLGATVAPATNQPSGTYIGTVTLTFITSSTT